MDPSTLALLANLQTRLRHLEDLEALRTLINTYASACDAGDIALFTTTFAADSVLAAAWFGEIRGRDAIGQGVASARNWGRLMHSISNMQVEITGEGRATGTAYLSFYAVKDRKELGRNYVFGGPYYFTFERLEGEGEEGGKRGWRVRRLEIERWWEQGADETGAFGGDSRGDN